MPTLADLTVKACAQAVLDWFERALGMQPQQREVVFVDRVPWLDFRGFVALREDGNSHVLPGMWCRLSNEPLADEDDVLGDGPFIVELHTRNPTRVEHYVDPDVSAASRPLPWRRLLIYPTETAVLASTFGVVAPNWYTTAWPFRD